MLLWSEEMHLLSKIPQQGNRSLKTISIYISIFINNQRCLNFELLKCHINARNKHLNFRWHLFSGVQIASGFNLNMNNLLLISEFLFDVFWWLCCQTPTS